MYTTLHLILAHFLADFPFQPRWLADYKKSHFSGVILHSLTHLVTSAILLMPFLGKKETWITIVLIFLLHNSFDQLKIQINRLFKINKFGTYVVDQASHLVVIVLASVYYLGPLTPNINDLGMRYYGDQSIVLYLLAVTVATYFYDVTLWTYRSSKKEEKYKRNYSIIARNFIIVTLGFVIYWVTS